MEATVHRWVTHKQQTYWWVTCRADKKRGKTSNTEQTRNELYLRNRIINERAGDLLRENGMALPQVWNLHHFQSFIPISICAGTDLAGGLGNKRNNHQFPFAQVQILWEVSNQCGESLMVPVLGMRGCVFCFWSKYSTRRDRNICSTAKTAKTGAQSGM